MKNNLKYRLSALLFLASALTITSCSDWTDVESLQLNTPTFEEQNPQLYADYLKDLKNIRSLLFLSRTLRDLPASRLNV